MWYVCAFYTMRSPSLLCIGNYVMYIYCLGNILPMHPNYICVCIFMFVNHVTVSIFFMFVYVIQYSYWLYLTLVFCYIFLLCMVYSTTAPLFHMCLYWYVCEYHSYVYCDIFVQFIISTPWLYPILGILSCIFPVYHFLFHCCHTCWPTFTKVD